MNDIKISAIYKNGILIPKFPLNIENGSEVEVILNEDLYHAFSLASDNSDVEKVFYAQKEIVEKNE